MIRSIFKYLFPGLRLHEKLPLLPRGFSSEQKPDDQADPYDVRFVLGRGAARTAADAHRLLIKHQGEKARHVANEKRKERRRESRRAKAWGRVRGLFK